MRSRRLAGSLLLVLSMVTALDGWDKAKVFYGRGKQEEDSQNYEAAYEDYRQAWELKPTDIAYRTAVSRTRFLAAAAKVHRGLLLREAGKSQEALKEFEQAARIDPSSPIAQQEFEQTRRSLELSSALSKAPPESRGAVTRELQEAAGPAKLTPIPNTQITLKLMEDSKVIYETIGKLAGINVLFDPDYNSRRIHVELNGVTLQQSLEIVALESNTFWRPVTSNTIFVAAETPAKHKELEQSVIKTFYMSNVSTPTELQDLVNAMRNVLEVGKIQPMPSKEAIVVRGTPDQILLAEKLVHDFDTAQPEVIIELAIMQVSRDKLHNLGVNPPTSASVQLKDNSSSSSSSSANTINLNRLGNLNATDFTATISSASANALLSDSATKIIQNPQLRSVDGQKATLRIGDRVPTATGSYQSGVGGVAVNSLVGTQFQYLDVGVNLDVTPHIHANGDISLKIALEVSSVTTYVTIGSISEPVIGQRKVEHEIRLRDGEVNLLGGMLEEQDIRSLSGIPGLAQIPLLKYLFSESNTEIKNNETVFALVPHIVRKTEFDELNARTLDVGTPNSIHLRHTPEVVSAKASDSEPVAAKSPGDTVMALAFDPPATSVQAGSVFSVSVELSGAQDVSSVPLRLSYDPAKLQILNFSNGDLLAQGDQVVALVHRENSQAGTVEVVATRPTGTEGVFGHGSITTLTFLAKARGQSVVRITDASVVQASGQHAEVSAAEFLVTVP